MSRAGVPASEKQQIYCVDYKDGKVLRSMSFGVYNIIVGHEPIPVVDELA